jgi:hypothetical protein
MRASYLAAVDPEISIFLFHPISGILIGYELAGCLSVA